jgi:acyl carrier protein
LDIVSDKTGYPAEMLELDMDMEADLGIDSIKRVEILSALQDEHPDLPEIETEALAELRTLGQIIEYTNERMGAAAPQPTSAEKSPPESTPDVPSLAPEPQAAPAAGPALDTEALTTALLDIVSDKTGYPAEMLELDMDMEADLGIDSIKRVEILSALQDKHPGLPEVEAEALAELRTLGQITEYMEQQGDTEKKA